MSLLDIKVGTNLVVEFNHNGVLVTRDTSVVRVSENVLLCEPIKGSCNNNLPISSVINNCTVKTLDKSYERVLLKVCSWNNKDYIVLSSMISTDSDRRTSSRQYIGVKGFANNDNSLGCDIKVRDLSLDGVAFTHTLDNEFYKVGDRLKLCFDDKEVHTSIELSVEVTRLGTYGNGKTLCGCKILNSNFNIGNYIAIKQVQELNKNN